ncbi:hypothetical protein KAH81_10320 [bacterium]|nr:hypothetical protein [bacterium]
MDGFDGETSVAFIDISGLKRFMEIDRRNKSNDYILSYKALDKFYKTAYKLLKKYKCLDGIFVSDCGIVFIRQMQNDNISSLLDFVKDMNSIMLKVDPNNSNDLSVMLTTSIAYGNFKFEDRIELINMDKGLFIGEAYLSAYLDSTKLNPKLKPCECRIVKESIPDNQRGAFSNWISQHQNNYILREKGKHYYYYWMLSNHDLIDKLEEDYKDARFRGIKEVVLERLD